MPSLLTRFIVCFLFSCFTLHAQEKDSPPAVTSGNPTVSEEELALSLSPLTKEELDSEAASWQTLLKAKTQEIANLEISSLNGQSGDTAETNDKLIVLRDQKSDLIKRYETVLDALDLKGGDSKSGRQYIAAVEGIKTTATDIGSRAQAFNAWFKSQDGGIRIGIMAAQFIGILVVFWILAIVASKVIHRAIEKRARLSMLLKTFINEMSRRIILIIGLIVALGTIGVNVGAALALIGGGAFILAFALQDTLSNFANGVMLLIYRPFDVGDAVEIGGVIGKVDSVSLVRTTILTYDNRKVLVPNNKVWGEVITNITGMATRRVDMIFGIGYSDSADKAIEIIDRVVRENPLVFKEPMPNIGIHELAASSVNIRCWPWAKTSDWLTVRTEVTKRVKEEFDSAGISIPFPQRDLHIYNESSEKETQQPADDPEQSKNS